MMTNDKAQHDVCNMAWAGYGGVMLDEIIRLSGLENDDNCSTSFSTVVYSLRSEWIFVLAHEVFSKKCSIIIFANE